MKRSLITRLTYSVSAGLALMLLLTANCAKAQDAALPQVVALWVPGAATLQGANEKELISPADAKPGQRINSIRNVHNPSIEIHLAPAATANGTAMIVAPGGGHEQLVWNSEGVAIAKWLNDLGISAFVLKYRLEQTPNYHYTVEKEALMDTQRAIRIVRSRAKEWNVNPSRIGILGFSAGGALAAYANTRFDRGAPAATDPIERESCRPDFVGMVYAGWKHMDTSVPKDAAPTFLTSAGSDDQFHARQTVQYYSMLFEAGIPAELHIYGHGGHGGAISSRKGIPFGTWQIRFQEWLADLGLLKPAAV